MIRISKSLFFMLFIFLIFTFPSCTGKGYQGNDKKDTIDNYNTILEKGNYTDAKVINSKEEAFELLKNKLNLTDEIYKYSGIDKYNGYIYSYKGNDSTNNYPNFIVNPYTGNVYDEVSSGYIINLNIKNDNYKVFTVEEIEDLLINKNIVELSDNTLLQFYFHEAGDVIIALFKKEEYEIISAFRINPLNGNVYNYSTGEFINTIRNTYDVGEAEVFNNDFDSINVKIKKIEDEVEVNKDNFQKKEVELNGYSTEGGFTEGYYLDNDLKYIESTIFGEMGKVAYEIYIIEDNLTFFIETIIKYNKPIYEDDFKIVEEITAKYVILENEVLEFNEISETLNEVKSSDEIKESVDRITESLNK